MAQFPPQVEAFHQALKRLIAVQDAATGLKWLPDFGPETYSLPGEFGDLPHALLRRTGGGLEEEAWLHTEFDLSRDSRGWTALEFLAWWVRDCSRSGVQIQIRPMALPPGVGEGQVQLGTTLKFIIDQFVTCPGGDKSTALARMQEQAESLSENIDDYREALGDLVRD